MRRASDQRLILLVAAILTLAGQLYAEQLRIVSYNTENLFHPAHDSVMVDSVWQEKNDWEWTPEGERRWSYKRYYRKVENIARVLTNIGEWDGVDIVGLQEVENATCLKRLCNTLRRGEYGFVHYESPDPRGIDVALLYKKARVDTIRSRAIDCSLVNGDGSLPELVTRDILYVCARVDRRDTLHLFVCHLPSQLGGTAESEWKRKAVKRAIQNAVDSVFAVEPNAKIIVMGDMNSAPKEDIKGLRNRMLTSPNLPTRDEKNLGTHKYRGRWECLDQFYVSEAIDSISTVRIYDAEWIQEPDERYLGLRPKRTFNGYRYNPDGYSDHLPIVLEIDDLTPHGKSSINREAVNRK